MSARCAHDEGMSVDWSARDVISYHDVDEFSMKVHRRRTRVRHVRKGIKHFVDCNSSSYLKVHENKKSHFAFSMYISLWRHQISHFIFLFTQSHIREPNHCAITQNVQQNVWIFARKFIYNKQLFLKTPALICEIFVALGIICSYRSLKKNLLIDIF